MKRILLVSDIHGEKDSFEVLREFSKENSVDLLIICGDLTPKSHVLEGEKLGRFQKEKLIESLEIIENLNYYFILGNDDLFEIDHTRRLTKPIKIYEKIWLVPFEYIPFTPFNSARERSEEELKKLLNKIKIENYKPFIFISHAPPHKILDNARGRRLGSKAIRNFVFKNKPIFHCFGHVHESYGYKEENGIHFFNASYDEGFLRGFVVELDLEKMEILDIKEISEI